MAHETVHIDLRQLSCHRPASRGINRPYLWTAFFCIDGEQVKLSKEFQLEGRADLHFSPGSHGNLEVEEMREGQMLRIPAQIGSWQHSIFPIKVPYFEYDMPAITGVIAVLLLQERVSSKGAEAGHQAFNNFVAQALNEALTGFDVRDINVEQVHASIKAYFSGQVEKFADGIEKKVTSAVIDAQNLVENLWSFTGRDTLVGYRVWEFTRNDLVQAGDKIRFSQRWPRGQLGDWEIFGQVSLDRRKNEPTSSSSIEIE